MRGGMNDCCDRLEWFLFPWLRIHKLLLCNHTACSVAQKGIFSSLKSIWCGACSISHTIDDIDSASGCCLTPILEHYSWQPFFICPLIICLTLTLSVFLSPFLSISPHLSLSLLLTLSVFLSLSLLLTISLVSLPH